MPEPKAIKWLSRAWEYLYGAVPEAYQRQFIRSRAQTNVRRMWVLSLFIICVQAARNLIHFIRPRPFEDGDVIRFAVLSLLTLSLGILFLILSVSARRGYLKNEQLLRVLPFVLLYVYVGIQLFFFSFYLPFGAGSEDLIIILLAAGLFLVVPPLQTILTLGTIFILQYGVTFYHQTAGDIQNMEMFTDKWLNIGIIALLILYIACIMFDVYLHNFLNQTRLEGSNQQLERIAQTDSLTEILNRRGFFKTVDRDWAEYISHNQVVAVCMFDIDYFKKFNDQYGHLVGDECLRMVGQRLQRFFERIDGGIVSRFGGEEFLAVFRGVDAETVIDVAWQACRAIRRAELVDPASGTLLQVTISGGLAFGSGEYGCDALIRRADEALYQAKAEGRNRICVSGDGAQAPAE